jgi:hypothetical protein
MPAYVLARMSDFEVRVAVQEVLHPDKQNTEYPIMKSYSHQCRRNIASVVLQKRRKEKVAATGTTF